MRSMLPASVPLGTRACHNSLSAHREGVAESDANTTLVGVCGVQLVEPGRDPRERVMTEHAGVEHVGGCLSGPSSRPIEISRDNHYLANSQSHRVASRDMAGSSRTDLSPAFRGKHEGTPSAPMTTGCSHVKATSSALDGIWWELFRMRDQDQKLRVTRVAQRCWTRRDS